MSGKYERTERITQRRKALFPTDGSASPQHSSDSNFSDIQALDSLEADLGDAADHQHFFKNNLTDYIILNKNSAIDDNRLSRLLNLNEGECKSDNRLNDGECDSLKLVGCRLGLRERKDVRFNVGGTEEAQQNRIFSKVEKNINSKTMRSDECKENDVLECDEENRLGSTELNSCTPTTRSSLYSSPMHTLLTSPILYSPRITRALTPIGRSPTASLKTPNDNTVRINAKNQKRKMDSSIAAPKSSPAAKSMKMDPFPSANKSKVRTALFTDMVVPTSSFYPKTVEKYERHVPVATFSVKPVKRKPSEVYLCNNKRRNKRGYGQINAGVRHKIKKPKQKKAKPSKVQMMRVALNILDNSPLNEYLKDITLLNAGSFNRIKKIEEPSNVNANEGMVTDRESEDMITDKENVPSYRQNIDKENTTMKNSNHTMDVVKSDDEENVPSKRFFKSKTRKGVVKINENIRINMANGKYELLARKTSNDDNKSSLNAVERKQEAVKAIFQTSSNDFNMTVGNEVNVNISNILHMLDDSDGNETNVSTEIVNNVQNTNFDTSSVNATNIDFNRGPNSISTGTNACAQIDFTRTSDSMSTGGNGGVDNVIPSPCSIVKNVTSTETNCNGKAQLNQEVLGILNDFNDDSNDSKAAAVENGGGFFSPRLLFSGMSPETNVKKSETTIDRDLILSPTSQMCNMASGLALNSPKKAILNITSLLDDVQTSHTSLAAEMDSQKKLFPVFYGAGSAKEVRLNDEEKKQKRWRSVPEDQYLLDAGQKRFGHTQCHECGAMYHAGDPNEEISHQEYHNSTNILKFTGWRNERVVGNFNGGRVLKIVPGDSKSWWKKIKDLMVIINRDLGYYELELPIDKYQVYIYVQNKQIAGCLMAEPKSVAYKMLKSSDIDLCSEESYPVKCGISRLWVAPKHRRKSIASSMVQVLRLNFVPGFVLGKEDLAVSSPTETGKLFAARFFGTDNFHVYLS